MVPFGTAPFIKAALETAAFVRRFFCACLRPGVTSPLMLKAFHTPPDLLRGLAAPAKANVPLAPRTWYRTGGSAAVYTQPENPDQLAAVLARAHEHGVPFYVLGSGANLLVADAGVDGVVIRLDAPGFRKMAVDAEARRVVAGAGADLFKLVPATAKAGLDGLVQVAGIPASVGGAVRMNAGGAPGDISRGLTRVRVMDGRGDVNDLPRDAICFGYRHTDIAAPLILEAEWRLDAGDPRGLTALYKTLYARKRDSQPMGDKSAGCCFRNPPPGATDGATAGMLIDRAGLKGFRVGGAEVSPLHANFVTAAPGSTTANVLAVMDHVADTVDRVFGVRLQREVVVWGADGT